MLRPLSLDRCKEALEGMVEQFAHRSTDGNRRRFTTGGLSALEEAFDALGWKDPHYVDYGSCDIVGCSAWSTCVGAYPRSLARSSAEKTMAGFGYLCSAHFHQWNGPRAESSPDLGRESG